MLSDSTFLASSQLHTSIHCPWCNNMLGLGRPFADDTSIGHIAQYESTLRNMINTDLNHLKKWSNRWLLKFNSTKTEIIIFNVNGVGCNLIFNFDKTTIYEQFPYLPSSFQLFPPRLDINIIYTGKRW
jgi:hypothetical protein